MKPSRSINEVINALRASRVVPHRTPPLYTPGYTGTRSTPCVMLAVESMKRHMTDEGWQLQQALFHSGYQLAGYNLPIDCTDTREIVRTTNPAVVAVQDKREWDQRTTSARGDSSARFTNLEALHDPNIFKVTVIKDAHQHFPYHATSAMEICCHAWIVYYHPKLVHTLASFTRPQHLIRTYHSIDKDAVPSFSTERKGCLLSGAISRVYPLRTRLALGHAKLPDCTVVKHPGYHCQGTATPDYLKTLAQFKVAICTSSIYGYALRKIVEATACGCRVLTDLPVDDVLPEIDENLVRIHPDTQIPKIAAILRELIETYNPERQQHLAQKALWYDYRESGKRLAADIEFRRQTYATNP